jgi:hypothetical protein
LVLVLVVVLLVVLVRALPAKDAPAGDVGPTTPPAVCAPLSTAAEWAVSSIEGMGRSLRPVRSSPAVPDLDDRREDSDTDVDDDDEGADVGADTVDAAALLSEFFSFSAPPPLFKYFVRKYCLKSSDPFSVGFSVSTSIPLTLPLWLSKSLLPSIEFNFGTRWEGGRCWTFSEVRTPGRRSLNNVEEEDDDDDDCDDDDDGDDDE